MPQRRSVVGATAVALVAGVLVGGVTAPPAEAASITQVVSADAFTASDHPLTTHNGPYVSMDASPRAFGYFRFDVVIPAGERVTSALFRCYVTRSNSAGASLWKTASTWSETTLKWGNAPVPNFNRPPIATTGRVTAGHYAQATVTAAIVGTGTYTLVARTRSALQWSCASRENYVHHPAHLVITTAPGPATTTTTADTFTASTEPHATHNGGYVSMDAVPVSLGYFKFTVDVPVGRQVSSAVFRCYAATSNSYGMSLWRTNSVWWERTLTWANAPRPDFGLPAIASTGPVTAGRWASADVTAAITGSGRYTLVGRTGSPTHWSCASKENPIGNAAQLVVTTTLLRPDGAAVVDAIGDGGADAAHWNATMAAAIRADHPDVFLWAGDVRNTGTPAEWQLYDAQYGALKSVTLPTPGNHDWASAATGYNVEFGTGAPFADIVTYCNAITLANGWSLFSINTYTAATCLPALESFLTAPGTRKLVLTHAPRWSGGGHGSSDSQAPIWDVMKGHAFALIAGHDHDAQVIERDGMVQVVSGCAGASYGNVTPIEGQVYYSTSAADCTFSRLVLADDAATVQAVHPDGTVDFSKTYPVSAS